MKQFRLRNWQLTAVLLLLAVWLLPLGAWAADPAVEIDGIYYKLDATNQTAEVTKHPSKYSGEITVPSTVTNEGITYTVTVIGYDAFYNCKDLTKLTLPNTIVELAAWAVSSCQNLTELKIPESVTTMRRYSVYNVAITELTIPAKVSTIESQAIYRNSKLTGLTVAAGNTTYDSRGNCNAIIETATNTLIAGCKSTSVPNSVTAFGDYSLAGTGLTSLTLNEGVTSIGNYAFQNLGITSVTIPTSVMSIGRGAFSECYSLTSMSVVAGNAVYESPAGSNAIVEKDAKKLVSACLSTVIPDDVTTIGAYAFCGVGQQSITLPSGVVKLEEYAFSDCYSLQSISLNEGLKTINWGAFSYCWNLSAITLPSTLQEIGDGVFSSCEKLKDVTCMATEPPFTGYYTDFRLFGYYDDMSGVTLHVPAGSESAYQAVVGWKDFGTIVGDADLAGASYKSTFVGAYSWNNTYSWDGSLIAKESDGATTEVEARDWQATIHTYPNAHVYMTRLGDDECLVFDQFGQSTNTNASSDYLQINLTSVFPITGKVKNVVVRCAGNVNFMVAESVGETDSQTYFGSNETSTGGMHDYTINCESAEANDKPFRLVIILKNNTDPFFLQSITINVIGEGGGEQRVFPLYAGDQGTPDAPYQIKTTDDLDLLAKLTNAGTDFNGKYFLLTDNLDYGYMSSTTTEVKTYTPVGGTIDNNWRPFRGIFNGGGHIISGIRISSSDYNGVFGIVDYGGEVRNLVVASSHFSGYGTGAIVGYNSGMVQNCHTASDVKVGNGGYGSQSIGGIVGFNAGNVWGCTNAAEVNANTDYGTGLGGIVGTNRGDVKYCLNFGTVKGAYELGSIVGKESSSTYNTPVLENNLYYGSTVGGLNGYDRYGAMKADINTSAPSDLGSVMFTFDALSSLPTITAYEFGLKYGDYYYYPASWPTKHFPISGGTGTRTDPYIIASASDLKQLSADVESGYDYKGASFAIAQDIEFYDAFFTLSGRDENFTPIGNPATPFRGRIDGRGHKVSGLVIKRTQISDKAIGIGLFGFMRDSAEVKNLTLANSYFIGLRSVGGIAGDMRTGSALENCHVLADVELIVSGYGCGNIGGVAGIMQGSLYGCTNAGKVHGDEGSTPTLVGGLTGQAGVGEMKNCLNLGPVTGAEYNTGAISGTFYSDLQATNNYYAGTFAMKAIGTGKGTSEDRENACQAYPFSTQPAGIGAKTTQYDYNGVTAYEHGLLFGGTFYYPDETGGKESVEVAGLYYELDDKTMEATVIPHPTSKYSGSITIPATVTKEGTTYSVTAIGDEAFMECRELTAITIGDNVTTIGVNAFQTSDKLETIVWNNKVKTIGRQAFWATKITGELHLPASVEVIGRRAFYHCEWVTDLYVGANVRAIGNCAFGGMFDLKTISVDANNKLYSSPADCNAIIRKNDLTGMPDTLVAGSKGTHIVPEGVKIILDEAFSWRRGLTITLPTTLEEIEDYAFMDALINDMTCLTAALPKTGSMTFGDDYGTYKVLRVQPDLVDTYKATAPWSLFQQIVAIDTGIDGVAADSRPHDVYDLNGRKVRSQVTTHEGLPRGIYVVNGRKVVIK